MSDDVEAFRDKVISLTAGVALLNEENKKLRKALREIISIPLGPDRGSAQSQIDCAIETARATLGGPDHK